MNQLRIITGLLTGHGQFTRQLNRLTNCFENVRFRFIGCKQYLNLIHEEYDVHPRENLNKLVEGRLERNGQVPPKSGQK